MLEQKSIQESKDSASDYSEMQEYYQVTLLDLWKIIWNGRLFIGGLTFIAAIIGVGVALTSPLVYRAEVLLAPAQGAGGGLDSMGGGLGGIASFVGLDLSSNDKSQRTLAILSSRQFNLRFIDQNNLRKVLFESDWDRESQEWTNQTEPSDWKVFSKFSKIVEVFSNNKTGLVTLGVEWGDPKKAAEWANLLVKHLNLHMKEQDIKAAKKSIAFLKNQLKETNIVDMKNVLYRIIESQMQIIMLASVNEEYAYEVIDPAVEPEIRIKPKRTLMVFTGAIMGCVFAIALVFIRQLQKLV